MTLIYDWLAFCLNSNNIKPHVLFIPIINQTTPNTGVLVKSLATLSQIVPYTLIPFNANLQLQELKQRGTCRHCSKCNSSCTCTDTMRRMNYHINNWQTVRLVWLSVSTVYPGRRAVEYFSINVEYLDQSALTRWNLPAKPDKSFRISFKKAGSDLPHQ